MNGETITLSLRELSQHLKLSVPAARARVNRAVKAGRWQKLPGNHPSDPLRVRLPKADLDGVSTDTPTRTPTRTDTPSEAPEPRPPARAGVDDDAAVQALAAALSEAQRQVADLTGKLIRAEADAAGSAAREIMLGRENDLLDAENGRLHGEIEALRARGLWARLVNR